MRKKSTLKSKILALVIPFFTVLIIVCVALMVYAKVSQANYGNGATIAIMLVTVLVLSLLFTIADFIRRKITNSPVDKILKATEKIASGDFNVNLTPSHDYDSYNDYDLIMENINSMVLALKKSALLNTDFVSNVSHEIKTPLAIIKSHLKLLEKSTDEDTRRDSIKTINNAVNRLNGLVTNVLKLNKLENQDFAPTYTTFHLHDSIAECLIAYEEKLDDKNISLLCDLDEITVNSDKGYLEIVWSNLISNAIKFTPNGGSISVSLKPHPRGAIVEITDTGCGISPDTGARIFEKFYQGDTSHSSDGNGLGLALVKKIIDLLGGEIAVKSELGVGTTFRITIISEQK